MADGSAASPRILERFDRWSRLLIGALVGGALALLLLLGWTAPGAVVYVPPVLLGAAGMIALFRRPLWNLAGVLAGFVFIASFSEGFQITEAIYGVYYVLFLGHWFARRLLWDSAPLIRTSEDRALLFFLLWAPATLACTVLFGGQMVAAIRQLFSLSMLLLYFPVREACLRDDRAPHVILAVLLWLGLFVALRNLVTFGQIMTGATAVWEVIKGRVISNTIFLVVASFATLVLFLHRSRLRTRAAYLVGFLIFLGSLVLTQTRAYWAGFAFGGFILFLLLDARQKGEVLLLIVGGVSTFLGVAYLLFGDLLLLLASGLWDRLVSIPTAIWGDPSLNNRIHESLDLLEKIMYNPIVGYGPGVRYETFDVLHQSTFVKHFVHNGYLSLWYRFGLIGLVPVLFIWVRHAWMGFRMYGDERLPAEWREYALIGAITLTILFATANTANPFHLSDTLLTFGVLCGWIAGMRLSAGSA